MTRLRRRIEFFPPVHIMCCLLLVSVPILMFCCSCIGWCYHNNMCVVATRNNPAACQYQGVTAASSSTASPLLSWRA